MEQEDYPVYLHTQPSSYRAIKLYSDFGFEFLSDPIIGYRENELEACLPILRQYMTEAAYQKLKVTKAPQIFLDATASSKVSQF